MALTILVTGATDGIGRETARVLLAAGHRVLVHGRSEKRARAAVAALPHESDARPVWADFAELAQVLDLARQVQASVPALDVLVNNAGIYAESRETTVDGFERTMGVNYFAPWLLTHAVRDCLRQAGAPRVVNVSSMTHSGASLKLRDLNLENGWAAYGAYAISKLANLLFSAELARREPWLDSNGLHPGVIGTKLLRAGFGMGGASLAAGARTPVWLATAAEVAGTSGRYFVDCAEQRPSRQARDEKLAGKLWTQTEALLGNFLAQI